MNQIDNLVGKKNKNKTHALKDAWLSVKALGTSSQRAVKRFKIRTIHGNRVTVKVATEQDAHPPNGRFESWGVVYPHLHSCRDLQKALSLFMEIIPSEQWQACTNVVKSFKMKILTGLIAMHCVRFWAT